MIVDRWESIFWLAWDEHLTNADDEDRLSQEMIIDFESAFRHTAFELRAGHREEYSCIYALR